MVRGITASVLVVVFVVLAGGSPAAASPAQGPVLQSHTVRQGDTLWSLARRFGTTPERLAELNGISPDAILAIGRVLRVPAGAAAAQASAARSAPARPAASPAVAPTRTHRIQAGDTLWNLARRHGSTPARLAALNGISENATLRIGQTLKLPGSAVAASPARPPAAADPVNAPARREALRARLAALPSRGEAWMDDLLEMSRRYLGVRYRWGGTTPAGFDCSGLLYYVFGRKGVTLPRTTYDMYDAGVPVPREDLQAGDVLFFQTLRPGPSHAGIYLGDGRFIHASSGAGRVLITDFDHGYYAPRYLGARRF
jgi:peptidoglycan endopeptidase LytE